MGLPRMSLGSTGKGDPGRKYHIGFLLLPGFSHYSFSAALEPLRSANILMGREVFTWSLIGHGMRQVSASNGVACLMDYDLENVPGLTDVLVFSGSETDLSHTRPVENWLRFHHRQGGGIRAVSSGVMVLARTGLLDGRDCAAHWEDSPRLRENHPRINVTERIFELGERISTCAGGEASAHMMLAYLERILGSDLTLDVATRMVMDRIRDGRDSPNLMPHIRYGTSNKLLLDAIAIMNDHIGEPRKIKDLAKDVGASVRQLERQFKAELGATPEKFYRSIRLSLARQLLQYSDHSLTEIALICGFGTTQAMKKHYETRYGRSPRAERCRTVSGKGDLKALTPAPILHEVNAFY